MSTAVGTAKRLNGKTGVSKKKAAARRSTSALKGVMSVAFLLFMIVLMAAYGAGLQRQNNELRAQNDLLQAEVDSLNEQIGDATNISRIETVATGEYGMIHPDSSNYVNIGKETSKDVNLAATIKDEAYD
jgi:cell division protein FtsL